MYTFPYCSVIQWNLSVLQEISGRTDGILKPCKDTHLLPNGDGYESGLWTRGSLVCESAEDEVKFPFRWCPEYEGIWCDDRVLGVISFGHNSGLIATDLMQFYSFFSVNNGQIRHWMNIFVYMCFNWDVQVLFGCVAYFFLCFPKLNIIPVSVSEAWECCYFFSEH